MKKYHPFHKYAQPSTLAVFSTPLIFGYLVFLWFAAIITFVCYPDESLKYRYLIDVVWNAWFKASMGQNDYTKDEYIERFEQNKERN